jgi:hypothetical protein
VQFGRFVAKAEGPKSYSTLGRIWRSEISGAFQSGYYNLGIELGLVRNAPDPGTAVQDEQMFNVQA